MIDRGGFRHGTGVRRLGPIVAALIFCAAGAAEAGNQQVRISAIMAGLNGDSSVQYIELEYKFGDDEWGPQNPEPESRTLLEFHDGTGFSTGSFKFPSDPTAGPAGFALVGSPAFAAAFPGVPLDFELPGPMVVGVDGMVCFRRNPDNPEQSESGIENVNLCVSYGDFQGSPDELDNCGSPTGPPLRPRIAESSDRGLPIAADPAVDSQFPVLVSTSSEFLCLTPGPMGSGTNANFALSGDLPLPYHLPQTGAGDQPSLSDLATDTLVAQGANIFTLETFDGNGRTCTTCHDPSDSFALSPATLSTRAPSDPLFVHLQEPAIALLEDDCLLQSGNQRGLFLENIDGFSQNPVFRSTPHLVNIAATAPYGMGFCPGPNCQTLMDLRAFCVGAIGQHYPKDFDGTTFERNSDPGSGLPLDFRAPAEIELAVMEAFQNDIFFPEKPFIDTNPGLTVEQRRDNTIDALIAQAVLRGGDQTRIDEGRTLFFGSGQCFRCHDGEALDRSLVGFSTGMTDHFDIGTGSDGSNQTMTNILANTDDGCDTGMFDPTLPLPAEASGVREFNTMPLIGIALTGPFFHDGSATTMREAVNHYNTGNFDFSTAGVALADDGNPILINGPAIARLEAFVNALSIVPEPRAALLQAFSLAALLGLRRRAQRSR